MVERWAKGHVKGVGLPVMGARNQSRMTPREFDPLLGYHFMLRDIFVVRLIIV